jgi:DNA gyrase subunit A
VIALIRNAADPTVARAELIARAWPAGDVAPLIALIGEPGHAVMPDGTYRLSDEQAKAILELRLQRLTGLEREKIAEELDEIVREIGDYLDILRSRPRLLDIMRNELREIKEQFATPRRTVIEEVEFEADIEALIQREDMVVTVSHSGYIKRVPLSTYRAQRRGGRGRSGMAMREEDFVSQVFVASTHAPVLFFTSSGRVFKLKVYRLPLGTPQARGKPMIGLLQNLAQGEGISAVMPLPEDEASWSAYTVVFATRNGYVRRNSLSDFAEVKANGKIAMKFEGEDADDSLISVAVATAEDDILLATRNGRAIRFSVDEVRVFVGRESVGVRGIRLRSDDTVISMAVLRHQDLSPELREAYLGEASKRRRLMGEESAEATAAEGDDTAAAEQDAEGEEEAGATAVSLSEDQFNELAEREQMLLSVTENGFGMRTSAYDYRITGRGGQGVLNVAVSQRRGKVVAVLLVSKADQIILATDRGMVIRTSVRDIRIVRRNKQGVVVFKVEDGEHVVSVARLGDMGDENGGSDDASGGEGGAGDGGGGPRPGDMVPPAPSDS